MELVKIRFAYCAKHNKYNIQRKTSFGWKDITYIKEKGYGPVKYLYYKETKKEILDAIVNDYFKVNKKHVVFIEYPELKYTY